MDKVERFINDYTRNCSNELINPLIDQPLHHPWITPDDAMEVAEIARKETIEEACQWLKDNAAYYWGDESDIDEMLADFRKEIDEIHLKANNENLCYNIV